MIRPPSVIRLDRPSGDEVRADDVDLDDPPEGGLGVGIGERGDPFEAGVVHQHVDMADLRQSPLRRHRRR